MITIFCRLAIFISLFGSYASASNVEYVLVQKPLHHSWPEYELMQFTYPNDGTKGEARSVLTFKLTDGSEVAQFVVGGIQRGNDPTLYARLTNGKLIEVVSSDKPFRTLTSQRIRFLAPGPNGTLLYNYNTALKDLVMRNHAGQTSTVSIGQQGDLVDAIWDAQSGETSVVAEDKTTPGRFEVYRVSTSELIAGTLSQPLHTPRSPFSYFTGYQLLTHGNPQFVGGVVSGNYAVGVLRVYYGAEQEFRLVVTEGSSSFYSFSLPTDSRVPALPSIVQALDVEYKSNAQDPALIVWLRMDHMLVEVRMKRGGEVLSVFPNVFTDTQSTEINPLSQSFQYRNAAKAIVATRGKSAPTNKSREPVEKPVVEQRLVNLTAEGYTLPETKVLNETARSLRRLVEALKYIGEIDLGLNPKLLERLELPGMLESFLRTETLSNSAVDAESLQSLLDTLYRNTNYEAFLQKSVLGNSAAFEKSLTAADRQALAKLGFGILPGGRFIVLGLLKNRKVPLEHLSIALSWVANKQIPAPMTQAAYTAYCDALLRGARSDNAQ